jgi:hypothetical protein
MDYMKGFQGTKVVKADVLDGRFAVTKSDNGRRGASWELHGLTSSGAFRLPMFTTKQAAINAAKDYMKIRADFSPQPWAKEGRTPTPEEMEMVKNWKDQMESVRQKYRSFLPNEYFRD